MADDKYNRKNPAVKRILQEIKEMQSIPSDDFMSLPLEVVDRVFIFASFFSCYFVVD